jgi:hypothetical protein
MNLALPIPMVRSVAATPESPKGFLAIGRVLLRELDGLYQCEGSIKCAVVTPAALFGDDEARVAMQFTIEV